MAEVEGLLVKVRTGAGFGLDAVRAFGDAEPILDVPPGTPNAFGVGAAEPAMWLKVASDGNAWDRAHSLLAGGYAADSSGVMAAEPDLGQTWVAEPSPKSTCQASGQDKSHGRAAGPRDGWHLDDAYSGLRTARASVPDADQARVTIAHLDTGWDPNHAARPRNVRLDKQINFTGEGARNDALDVTPKTGIFNRGHGPATIGLLAGGDPGFPIGGVKGPLGGAPGCRVIPIRIADSVVRLTTSTMVKGFKHALDCNADVLSMSMGGLASDAVADAINRCYEQGMVMVTAAGNFMPKIPSPRSTVYPARMRRVLAATGVMADGSPYFGGALTTMQGCHGPASKMETAIAGWTPNAPWVELGCGNVIDFDGSGTSAATPQVAAAAALWLAKYHAQLAQYPKRWMRGEAARQALLQSARKTTARLDQAQVRKALGAGTIDAVAALALAPMKWNALRAAPVASADWAWLKLLSGEGVGVAPIGSPRARMLGLELLQVVQIDPALEALIEDPDAEDSVPSGADRKGFLEAVRDSEASSQTLKAAIDRALGKSGPTGPRTLPRAPRKAGTAPRPEKPRPPAPTKRRLRIFALDPSLGGTLDLVDSKIATVDVRYERDGAGDSILRPGPVGEYLEVVDVDPASDQFYPPVDLDDPRLLLQDGLEPSEGNPAFHQQMVYAVGMRTIASFEQALGRRALWSPHRREQGAWEYVPRLRLYPHALRARNAYYSPNLVAILFGYFPAESDRQDATAPGTLVFGCLSADIIAHEMTHALLDGYTRGYRESSNPDVGAFHEAFADIVALFQHFQYRDLIRREIARARGDLNAATLLGELARQFGEGVSKRGALRDYLAENDDEYSTTFEVHNRGALLVKAIYEAFLAIFTRRTGDLIRLATGGSGVLEPGAIHPDLVDRLTDEACKAAGHVLRMCIRAIDYLPPIDVTFGAYLRALITADVGQVEDDRFGYRTALIQAFRRRDLLPGNLRTVSVETLTWSAPHDKSPPWLAHAVELLKVDWLHTLPRWRIYANSRDRCRRMHQLISEELARDPETAARQFGVELGVPLYDKDGAVAREAKGKTTFEVRNVRAARRQRPDGQVAEEIIVTLAQRRPEPFDGRDVANGFFWYRGGATLVINPSNESNEPEIKYLIWKRLGDGDRLERERTFRGYPPGQTSRALYFGARGVAGDEPFALLHSAED